MAAQGSVSNLRHQVLAEQPPWGVTVPGPAGWSSQVGLFPTIKELFEQNAIALIFL